MSNEAIDRTKLPIPAATVQRQGEPDARRLGAGLELANAVKKSVAQIDGMSAKKLKAGLAEAQAGMGG